MTPEAFLLLTPEQQKAIRRIYHPNRWPPGTRPKTFRDYLADHVTPPGFLSCAMVRWNSWAGVMHLGVEPDGYTHS